MRSFFIALFVAGLSIAPSVAEAGNMPNPSSSGSSRPASGKAHITVNVVHGTDSESGVDPRLASLSSQFRYFKHKGYRLLSTQGADLSVNSDQTFQIEGGRQLSVTLVSKDDTHARVRVEIDGKKGKLIDTTVKINRDGTFIVAGPGYKDGILYIPLKVSY